MLAFILFFVGSVMISIGALLLTGQIQTQVNFNKRQTFLSKIISLTLLIDIRLLFSTETEHGL